MLVVRRPFRPCVGMPLGRRREEIPQSMQRVRRVVERLRAQVVPRVGIALAIGFQDDPVIEVRRVHGRPIQLREL